MTSLLQRQATRSITERKKLEQEFLQREHGQLISNFKQYRLNHSLSLDDLARLSYISKNALIRSEQATYTNPMPALVTYWLRQIDGITELEITDAYLDYQVSQRHRHPLFFGLNLEFDLHAPVHPFRQLRKQHLSYADGELLPVGVDEVSRALCLPVDTLRYWEKKYRSQKSVPKGVQLVLNEIGYARSDVRVFAEDYLIWRNLNNEVTSHES